MKFQRFLLSRIKYLILILLFIVSTSNVNAIVKPTERFYINDYANILSNETEEYIFNRSVTLNNVDGTQIVVVTVPNLEGMSIEDYSIRVARSFGIGSKEKNNGLLLLIALEERELRIEVGYGLEGIIPDGKAGRFRDQYMIPYLKNNQWDEGIKNGYDAFFKEIVELNNLNIDYNVPIQVEDFDDEEDRFAIFMILNAVFAFVMGTIIGTSTEIKRNSLIYFSIWGILFIVSLVWFIELSLYLLPHPVLFAIGIFQSIIGGIFGGGFSRGGRSSSSRGGGFSGGGGSFGGGGASGKF